MRLQDINYAAFDAQIRKLNSEQPEDEVTAEVTALSNVAEDSKICGDLARQADQMLAAVIRNGKQRQLFASLIATGARLGWHLKRLTDEMEMLEGMLTPETQERLRREITEQALGRWD